MASKTFFQRKEIKYILTKKQAIKLKEDMKSFMAPDQYGGSTIYSIYYDTPDRVMIRRSIEKPIYREKLRIRSYGVAKDDDIVYIEMKRKFKKVVYKRRAKMKNHEAMDYMSGKNCRLDLEGDSQVMNELSYFKGFYGDLVPSMFISYDREAYFGLDDDSFRMTLDENICARDYDFDLTKGAYGALILPEDKVLLEVKTMNGLPIWFLKFLEECGLYKARFSKYALAYERFTFGYSATYDDVMGDHINDDIHRLENKYFEKYYGGNLNVI